MVDNQPTILNPIPFHIRYPCIPPGNASLVLELFILASFFILVASLGIFDVRMGLQYFSVASLRVCSVFFLRVLLELLGFLKRLSFRCVDGYAGRSISGLWVKSRTFAQKAPSQSVVVVVVAAPKLR